MIDHSRIKSGFDCEVLLGAEFFRMAIQTEFDAGKIIPERQVADMLVIIDRPTRADIMFGKVPRTVVAENGAPVPDDSEVDIAMTFPVTFHEATGNIKNTELCIFLKVRFTEKVSEITGLVDDIDMEMDYAGLHQDSWDWLVEEYTVIAVVAVDGQLREEIRKLNKDGQTDLSRYLVPDDIQKIAIRKLPAESGFQACYAMYLNLDLKLGPLSRAGSKTIPMPDGTVQEVPTIEVVPPEPDDQPVDRGDASLGMNFLPEDRHIALGTPPQLYWRLGRDRLHSFTEESESEPGVWSRPLKNRSEQVVGHINDIDITPNSSYLAPLTLDFLKRENPELLVTVECRTKGIKVITHIHVVMRIEDGELKADIRVDEPEAETGFIDFLAIFLGQFLTLGLVPVTGGLSLVAGGIMSGMTISMIHAIKENYEAEGKRMIEGMVKDKPDSLLSFLSVLPGRVTIVKQRSDPFYYRHFQVVTRFEEVSIEPDGMSFTGKVTTGSEDRPIPNVKLMGRVRKEEPVGELQALLYQVPKHDEIIDTAPFIQPDPRKPAVFLLTPEEAARRVEEKHLKMQVLLTAERVRVRDGQVKEIFFDTRAALAPFEAGELYLKRVLCVLYLQLIRPRNGRPYYRTKPDAFAHNNLPNLPPYDIAIAPTMAGEFSDFNRDIVKYATDVEDSLWYWVPDGQEQSPGTIASHAMATYSLMTELVMALAHADTVPDISRDQLDTALLAPGWRPDEYKREDFIGFLPGYSKELTEIITALTTEQVAEKGYVPLFDETMNTQHLIERLLDYLWGRLKKMRSIKSKWEKQKG